MKDIDQKQAPDVSGGYRPGDGGCLPSGPLGPFPTPFPIGPDPTFPCEPVYPNAPIAMLGEPQ